MKPFVSKVDDFWERKVVDFFCEKFIVEGGMELYEIFQLWYNNNILFEKYFEEVLPLCPHPPAELEILRCICDGLEYEEIALQRGITVNTVKYHVSNILQKTGYANRTRLAIAATNQKFIIPKLPEDTEF